MIRGLVNAPSVSIFPHLSGTARDSLRGMGGGVSFSMEDTDLPRSKFPSPGGDILRDD